MTKKKLLSLILAVIMVVSLLPTMAFAAEEGTTADNPILIYSVEDLAKINQSEQYLYAKLMTDIDLADAPVTGSIDGWWNARILNFRGELDGNNHTITNTTTGNALIGYFHEGVLKNFTWSMSAWSSLVAEQVIDAENTYSHTYSNITATGNVDWTTDNNNESALVTYAPGHTTFENVTLDMDMTTGVSYNGLFIGYEPYVNSDYKFINCTVKGNYLFDYVGVLFGNGSISNSNYGMQHVLGINNVEATSTITVENLNLSEAEIVGIRGPAKLLCGVSYNAVNMDAKETELAENVTGYDNLKQAETLDGITVALNADNQIEIEATEAALTDIGAFEVISEVYTNTYTNGVANGTLKISVSDRLTVQDDVTNYYSLLGKVAFYDKSSDGTKVTTGLNGELEQVQIGDTRYYTIIEQMGNSVYNFGKTPEATGISRLSSVRVAVYDKTGALKSTLNVTITGSDFDIAAPEFADDAALNVGDTLSQHALADGWTWAEPDTAVVEGGQWAFAVKDGSMVPVEFTGVPVAAESVTIGSESIELQIGQSTQLTAAVLPENATHKDVTWTSGDEEVAIVDEAGKVTALKVGTATITATVGALTDTCTVTVTPTEAEIPTIDPGAPVEEVAVGAGEEDAVTIEDNMHQILTNIATGNDTAGVSEETETAIADAVEQNKTISTEVVAAPIAEEEVSEEDKTEITSVLKENEQVAQYIDLSIVVKADNEAIGTIDELDKEITFTVAVPDALKAEGRIFFIIRLHNGTAERLDTVMNDDGTLSFSTDKFSTYALGYTDTASTTDPDDTTNPDDTTTPPDDTTKPEDTTTPEDTDEPKTGDNANIMLWIALLGVSVIGAYLTVVYTRRGKHSAR